MRVLVTGGAGLIGRCCVDALLEGGSEVRVLDLRANLLEPRPGLALLNGDLLDPTLRRTALKGASCVVHLAAVSRVQDAEEDPRRAKAVNVAGTKDLLADAAKSGRPPFIHASSREVYGEDPTRRLPEDAPIKPINAYGRTKALSEELVRAYGERHAPAVILRFANVYGSPFDHPGRVIPIFVRRSLAGEGLELQDGSKTFDFVHLDDARQAVSGAMGWADARSGKPSVGTFNVATGTGTTLRALAKTIQRAAHSKAPIVETTARDFDVRHFVGDPARAKEELGFESKVGLKAGIERTVDVFRRAAHIANA